MSKQANPTVIGGFVLGALALVVIAILVFSSGVLYRTEKRVTYFPGSVQGLSVGARVEFQGVQIGEVTDIRLSYSPKEAQLRIPVYYDIWPDKVILLGEVPEEIEGKSPAQYFVEDLGLRAQLISTSLVTGQYIVSLSLRPQTPVNYVGQDEARQEIPAIESARDRFDTVLEELDLTVLANNMVETLNSLKQLVDDPALRSLLSNTDQAVIEARGLLSNLNTGIKPFLEEANNVLGAYGQLAQTADQRLVDVTKRIDNINADLSDLIRGVNEQVESLSKAAVSTLQSVEGVVGENSSMRYDLELLLQEGAGAARSLRILADYLEQNPDALIKGRYGAR